MFYSVWSVHPCCHFYSCYPWRSQGHFINKRRQSYSPGIRLWGKEWPFFPPLCSFSREGWSVEKAELREERGGIKDWHDLKFPNSLQSPCTKIWVWPPKLPERCQKEPKNISVPFQRTERKLIWTCTQDLIYEYLEKYSSSLGMKTEFDLKV